MSDIPKHFSAAERTAAEKIVDTIGRLAPESRSDVLSRVNKYLREGYNKGQRDALMQHLTGNFSSGGFPGGMLIDPVSGRMTLASIMENRKELPLTNKERKDVLRQIRSRRGSIAEGLGKLEVDEARLTAAVDALEAFEAGSLVLQKPQGGMTHKLLEAFAGGNVNCDDDVKQLMETENFDGVSIVIEHDWASAFSRAAEFSEGEVPLPFENTVFEFQISSVPVLVCAAESWRVVFVRLGGMWVGVRMYDADILHAMLASQIRAACIALDAEVATKETIRAPERLNRSRIEKGRLPLRDYHVVRLARREKCEPLQRDPLAEPAQHKRLHFVRGHWRRYPTHKTWVKWFLRGDPDLGYIDKHYRL